MATGQKTKRKRLREPKIIMPKCMHLSDLPQKTRDQLILCAPLSPTQNTWDNWHWAKKRAYRKACYTLLLPQVTQMIGVPNGKPWTKRARISIIRCSQATREADLSNIWGGLKAVIDVLLAPQKTRTGCNLITDDSPKYLELGSLEDRRRNKWGVHPGPGTWIFLKRIE